MRRKSQQAPADRSTRESGHIQPQFAPPSQAWHAAEFLDSLAALPLSEPQHEFMALSIWVNPRENTHINKPLMKPANEECWTDSSLLKEEAENIRMQPDARLHPMLPSVPDMLIRIRRNLCSRRNRLTYLIGLTSILAVWIQESSVEYHRNVIAP